MSLMSLDPKTMAEMQMAENQQRLIQFQMQQRNAELANQQAEVAVKAATAIIGYKDARIGGEYIFEPQQVQAAAFYLVRALVAFDGIRNVAPPSKETEQPAPNPSTD